MTARIDFSAGIQPGERAPAPGELGLVQAFVNTHYDLERDHGAEILHSPRALRDWLAGRGLLEPSIELDRAGLRRALEVREGLRAMLAANNDGGPVPAEALGRLNAAAARPAVLIRFAEESSPAFLPARRDLDGALGFLLAIVARAQLDGRWQRFKACPGEHCGWAFYDHSRNQRGAWCSMSICGSRAKARAYRRRNQRVGRRR